MEHGKLTIVGIDPALRNFGYAIATVDIETGKFEVTDLELVKTEDDAGKKVRRNSDDLRRCRAHVMALKRIVDGAAMVAAEIPVGSQSARAMASYGACIGILAACDVPMIEVTPTENKVCATGKKTASKDEMIEWAHKKFPKAPWLTRKTKAGTVLKNENEHLADAVGAINAALQTEQWKQCLAMFRCNLNNR